MKALVIALALILSASGMNASDLSVNNKGKKGDVRKERMKSSLTQQINRHMYFPEEARQTGVEGKADVLLQVLPEGDVNVIMIQTANPMMKKFIERQVKKMKLDKNEVVAGELFKYRLVFKTKE